MKPYRLTDKEMEDASIPSKYLKEIDKRFVTEREVAIERIAQKKLLEWLEAECEEHLQQGDSYGHWYKPCHFDCPECWQSLLEDFGIKE